MGVREDEEDIQKILKHLGLWERAARPPPEKDYAPISDTCIDYLDSQIPPNEGYFYSDQVYPEEGWVADCVS